MDNLNNKPKSRKLLKGALIILFVLLSGFAINVEARSGCCSWHGGVSHCNTNVGRYVCNDGTYSPSCGCTYIPFVKHTYISLKQTEDDLIKEEVENSKIDYYRNNQWFREKLIIKTTDYLRADVERVAFYVYTILPDIK